jgi:hypothetical protein
MSDEINVDHQMSAVATLDIDWEPVGKQLRTRLRVKRDEGVVECDEVDLGKANKRYEFAKRIAAKTGVSVEAVDAQLLAILSARAAPPPDRPEQPAGDDLAEQTQEALKATDPAIIEEAEKMLESRDLIEQIGKDLEAVGVAGENALRLTLYLLGTSRLLDRPLAAIVQGQSSSGKSYTIDRVASLFPSEAVVMATQMTPQALFHIDYGSLCHRWVVAGERSRVDDDERAEATRALREMLSSGRLSKLMPIKEGGEIKTIMIEQPGPIAYVESTTATRLFEEDATRCILLSTDERRSQTKVILRQTALNAMGYGRQDTSAVVARHQTLQRLLQRREVAIPFAEKIAASLEVFTDRCQVRRAYPMLLSFIGASVLLHQRQRKTDDDGRLIAEPIDYEITVRLLSGPFESMVGGSLSAPSARFLERLHGAIGAKEGALPVPFTIDLIRQHIKTMGRSSVGNLLADLEDKGFLEAAELPPAGRGRPPKAWKTTDRETSSDAVLPTVDELFGEMGAGETETPDIPKAHCF